MAASCAGTTSSDDSPARPAVRAERSPYGSGTDQFAELWVPAVPAGSRADRTVPVAVLIHGGFWRDRFALDLMDPLAEDLIGRGFAVWNIEYARVGERGDAWPQLFVDVAAAVDHLADVAADHALDLGDVTFIGHSAGGHLAAWSGGRAALPSDAVGAGPRVVPGLVIGQGAVIDLRAAADDALGSGAVLDLLGGPPEEFPERYELAQPRNGPPRVVMVNGGDDRIVPERYSAADGYLAEAIRVDGADHFALIDPTSSAWAAVIETLTSRT